MEGAARVIVGQPMLSVTHPTIEYLFKPGQHGRRFFRRYDINAYGMRSPEVGPKRGFRLLVFGDSVINGGHGLDQSELATSLLPWETFNISAGSWGPPNQLAWLKTYGTFDADLVALVISSHDGTDVPDFRSLDPYTHPTHAPVSLALDSIRRYWPWHPAERTWPAGDALPALREFLQRTHAVVFLHPEDGQDARELDGIRAVCDAMHVRTVLLRYPPGSYRDSIHLNARGQQVIAATMERTIGPYAHSLDSFVDGDAQATDD